MNAAERTPYLEAGDAALLPLGFKRKKKEFEWRRAAGHDTEWIHINFGLDVINPSYGVRYEDIDASFPPSLGVRCGPWRMLQSSTGVSYSSSTTPPSVVSRDLLKAVDEFVTLRDRQAFAEMLMRDTPARNFTISSSHRMRMLPALLASLGRVEEAVAWLARFEKVAPNVDQMSPGYDAFAIHFRAVYQTKKTAI